MANTWKIQPRSTYIGLETQDTQNRIKRLAKKNIGNPNAKLQKNSKKLIYVETTLCQDPNNFRLNSWMHRLLKQREKLVPFN